jgi:outer membrane lipoprotein-sorting protein
VVGNTYYAQMVAEQMTEDYMSIESYQGLLKETGVIAADRNAHRLCKVIYERPWKIRSEVVEPEAMKGELFIYDGSTIILWWPEDLLGIRIIGAEPPPAKQAKEIVRKNYEWLLKYYAFSLRNQGQTAGISATNWSMIPTRKRPYLFPYDSAVAGGNSFPLKIVVYDKPEQVWYSMEYTEIEFGAEIPKETFTFEFPPNAVVLEWDLAAPHYSLKEIRKYMNFDVLVPKTLPKGHEIRKIIKGEHCLPMMALLMDRSGRWLSLTEIRSINPSLQMRSGIPIKIKEHDGYLHFLGALTVINWTQGKTYLSLIGNLPYPDLISVAASVE